MALEPGVGVCTLLKSILHTATMEERGGLAKPGWIGAIGQGERSGEYVKIYYAGRSLVVRWSFCGEKWCVADVYHHGTNCNMHRYSHAHTRIIYSSHFRWQGRGVAERLAPGAMCLAAAFCEGAAGKSGAKSM